MMPLVLDDVEYVVGMWYVRWTDGAFGVFLWRGTDHGLYALNWQMGPDGPTRPRLATLTDGTETEAIHFTDRACDRVSQVEHGFVLRLIVQDTVPVFVERLMNHPIAKEMGLRVAEVISEKEN